MALVDRVRRLIEAATELLARIARILRTLSRNGNRGGQSS